MVKAVRVSHDAWAQLLVTSVCVAPALAEMEVVVVRGGRGTYESAEDGARQSGGAVRRYSSELPKCTSQLRRRLDVVKPSTTICSLREASPGTSFCSFNSVHSRPFRKRMPNLC